MNMKNADVIIEKNEYRNWLAMTFVVLLAAMILVAGVVLWIDPFFHYHKPIDGFPYQIDHQLCQNPGMVSHFDYDSVLIGSSMTANFDASWFAELYDEQVLKLCYNGAYPHDIKNIFEKIDENPGALNHVYWGVDIISCSADPADTKYPIPAYLYNHKLYDDVHYFYNKDVLMDYIVKPVINHEEPTDINLVYSSEWWMKDLYGKEYVLSNYAVPEKNDAFFPDDMFLEGLGRNLEANFIPIIESHPNTRFTLFYPPVNVLYWYEFLQNNQMEAIVKEYEAFSQAMLAYENVEIHSFLNDDIVRNLDLYVDTMHHKESVDRYLAESFATDKYQLRLDTYEAELNAFYENMRDYDYEGLLSEKPAE